MGERSGPSPVDPTKRKCSCEIVPTKGSPASQSKEKQFNSHYLYITGHVRRVPSGRSPRSVGGIAVKSVRNAIHNAACNAINNTLCMHTCRYCIPTRASINQKKLGL